VGALEFTHEFYQRFDGLECDCVIDGRTHPADRAVAGQSHEPHRGSILRELLLDIFIATGDAIDYVHARPRSLLDGADIVAVARVDRVVQRLGFGFVALFDCRKPTLLRRPFEHHSNDVHRERRWRVAERLL